MKRKITELEQKLIDNGWKLINKTYSGKRSEKTNNYVYFKTETLTSQNINYGQVIKLNAKRTGIVDYGLLNVSCELLNDLTLMTFRIMLTNLRSFIKEIIPFQEKEKGNATSL